MNTSTNYSDYATFGIHSDGVRYTLACYTIFVATSSLIGDSLILYASNQRGAFKLHKVIVTIIQQIAVSDLLISITDVLPTAISLFAGSWVLGDTLCLLQTFLIYWVYPCGMYLICLLVTSKYLILKFPLRAGSWSKRRFHKVCGVIWLCSLGGPLGMYLVDSDDVLFDYRAYSCEYQLSGDILKKMPLAATLATTLATVAPHLIVITASLLTLDVARRAARARRRSVNLRGVSTVVLTAVVFLISTLPAFISVQLDGSFKEVISSLFHLHRVSMFLAMINIMSNFFIYCLTLTSFREFLLQKIRPAGTSHHALPRQIQLQPGEPLLYSSSSNNVIVVLSNNVIVVQSTNLIALSYLLIKARVSLSSFHLHILFIYSRCREEETSGITTDKIPAKLGHARA